MQHLAGGASRAHYLHETERRRLSGQEFVSSPDEILVFDSSDRRSHTSSSLSEDHYRSPSSVASTNAITTFSPYAGNEPVMKPRFVRMVFTVSRVFKVLSSMICLLHILIMLVERIMYS